MPQHRKSASRLRSAAFGVIVLSLAAGAAAQNQTPKRFIGGQIVIEDQGSFFRAV